MDESAACNTVSAPNKKRKRSKGAIGRHTGRRAQKTKRGGSIVAVFPSKREPSSTTSVGDEESNDSSIAVLTSDCQHEKHLRNRANYAKRQCVQKEEQVKKLLVEHSKIEESQREQEMDHHDINMKQKNQLSTAEASASKVIASLSGKVTRLSNALVKEKERVSFVRKSAKMNLTKLKDDMNSDKVVAVEALVEQHKNDLTTQANDHASVQLKMKEIARAKLASVRVKEENKLVQSKRASAAARNRLKVLYKLN